jgi:hypothetical protein
VQFLILTSDRRRSRLATLAPIGRGLEEEVHYENAHQALVAVVMATAAIGGVLAAPASAVVPLVVVRVQCINVETNTPVTITFVSSANGVGGVVGFARSNCMQGTLRLSVERV